LNSDFNYKHYGQFYEKIDEDMEKQKNEDELGNEANPAAEMTNAIQNN
jgi:hypothetical protein